MGGQGRKTIIPHVSPKRYRERCGLPKPLPLGATATTAASGGNREELLGPRPAGCERQRSRRWEPQPGQWHCEAMTERLSPAAAHGQAFLRTTSQSASQTAPLVGEPLAERKTLDWEGKLCGMPKPPLGRGGGTASAVTERLSPARASRSGSPSYNLSVSLRSTAPLVGEPLAKPFTLRNAKASPR